MRAVLLAGALLCVGAVAVTLPDFPYGPSTSSGIPLMQWTGDQQQMYEGATSLYYSQTTNSQALTNYGVWGGDEGAWAMGSDGRAWMFLGDSVTGWCTDGVPADCAAGTSHWLGYQVYTTCASGGAGATGNCLGVDTTGFLASGSTLYNCGNLSAVDAVLLTGSTPATPVPYTGCPAMTFVTDTTHSPTTTPAAMFTNVVSGLLSGESTLGGFTPTGVWDYGNHFYAIYEAQNTQNCAYLRCDTESILVQSSNTDTAMGANVGPAWTRLGTFTQAPTITTGSLTANGTSTVTGTGFSTSWVTGSTYRGISFNGIICPVTAATTTSMTLGTCSATVPSGGFTFWVLPNEATNTGTHLGCAPEIMTAATINGLGFNASLPAALQSVVTGGGPLLFLWCRSYCYRCSNLYLAAADPSTLTTTYAYSSGVPTIYYLSSFDGGGRPVWTLGNETNSQPLFQSWQHTPKNGFPCVGEQSVRYHPLLKRFVSTYGSAECGGLWVRTATVPWGPWSTEQNVWLNGPNSGWEGRLIHGPNANAPSFNTAESSVYIYDPNSPTTTLNSETIAPFNTGTGVYPGNAYAPFQLPTAFDHDNGNGSVMIFVDLSGFNPYQNWVASYNVNKQTGLVMSGSVSASGKVTLQ